MSPMEENNYSQQELFEQKKYISDLIDEKSPKKRGSFNIVFGSAIFKIQSSVNFSKI